MAVGKIPFVGPFMYVIPGANITVTSAAVVMSNQFQGVRVIFLSFAVKTLIF